MKLKLNFIVIYSFIFFAIPLFAQQSINDTELKVQPCPKEISNLYKHVKLKHNESLSLIAENEEEQKAADYFSHLIKEKFKSELQLNINKSDENIFVKILFEKINQEIQIGNDQYYEIHSDPVKKEILLRYKSQLGLLFAAVTLAEYFELNGSEIKLNYYDVKDYPDYYRRIISANPKPDEVFELLDYALKNKIESIAIASRQYPWFEVSEDYKNLFVKINEWKNKYGGPSIMQMHNIYEGKQIEISNPFDVNALKDVIKTGIENGADKLMILADDTPPFEYGEGYVLTSESDKKQFKHMADAHCFLMNEIKNWLEEKSFSTELYYVPPFYTYEDMHYGDMDLYKNTPWEEDAYKPFYRDLEYIGLNMLDEIFIMWCGPYVRSRTISMKNLYDWTYNLKGKTPFLWDNTIYSHNPFISTPMFSAWDNNLPVDFNNNTAGNGMFVNGDANLEDTKVTAITVNDYMWNCKNYNPQKSLNEAMIRLYGKENSNLLLELKETELNLRKTIGERELWFESDTLWSIIRKVRYIHSKNPFSYHLNYTRMKALRLQLKGSIPEPIDKYEFVNQCLEIDKSRNILLNKLKKKLPLVHSKFKNILMELPDFDNIQ